jgi:tetratricopeptide (TPR) repeat protein
VRVAAILSVGVVAMAALDSEADPDGAQAGSSAPRDVDAVRKEAGEALARGDLSRAHVLYERVSRLDPADAHAAREAGRAALALGDLAAGVSALTRADTLASHAPDPELHYLRGEALYALGQRDLARRDQILVERELRLAPPTRQSQLWLARVYARRGELARADLIYRSLTPPVDQPVDAEVSIHHAESCLLARDWHGAQRVLRALLARAPDHPRARELLASSLEASGDLEDELALREDLARHATTSRPVLDYGRALERSGDYAAALRVYRQAQVLAGGTGPADPELTSAVRRMRQRTSIELAATALGQSDPETTSLGEQVGIAVPFGSAHHLALSAWREHLAARDRSRAGAAGELSAAVALHGQQADVTAGAKLGLRDLRGQDGATDRGVSGSGFAQLRGRPMHALKLTLDTELNALWRETPRSLLEGGHVTGATVHAYGIALASRLIVDAGTQIRRLVLPGQGGGHAPMTSQLLGWVGLDAVLWTNFGHVLEGEVLDDDMVQPATLADGVVAGYRHFELRSDSSPDFLQRMSMVGRASIEEASLTARKVFAASRLGIELRGILGWDRSREVALSHLGMSLLAAPTRSSRISLSLDLGAESPHGFQGQARSGWVSYHADL